MRPRAVRATFIAAVVGVVGGILGGWSPAARACSGGTAPTPTAIPRSGSTNVSPQTSIVIESAATPTSLTLLAGGTPVGALSVIELGPGKDGAGPNTRFWRLVVGAAASGEPLLPSTEYVLSVAPAAAGSVAELTRFTTAAGYDKTQGTAPIARSMKLWRVRYPVKDISSGNCVFAEYHSFITVDYEPATVPNTATASIIHTFRLAPKTGGSEQAFIYLGDQPFAGLAPAGDYPLPFADWQPELDPTRQYCLTVDAFGDGDRARLALHSDPVCADVVQLSASGAPPPPRIDNGGAGGGGCAVAAAPPSSGPAAAGTALALLLASTLRGRLLSRSRARLLR